MDRQRTDPNKKAMKERAETIDSSTEMARTDGRDLREQMEAQEMKKCGYATEENGRSLGLLCCSFGAARDVSREIFWYIHPKT